MPLPLPPRPARTCVHMRVRRRERSRVLRPAREGFSTVHGGASNADKRRRASVLAQVRGLVSHYTALSLHTHTHTSRILSGNAQWLVATFGRAMLDAGSGVLDVAGQWSPFPNDTGMKDPGFERFDEIWIDLKMLAIHDVNNQWFVVIGTSGSLSSAGGRGSLTFELQAVHGVRCTLVEPRPFKLTKAQRRFLDQRDLDLDPDATKADLDPDDHHKLGIFDSTILERFVVTSDDRSRLSRPSNTSLGAKDGGGMQNPEVAESSGNCIPPSDGSVPQLTLQEGGFRQLQACFIPSLWESASLDSEQVGPPWKHAGRTS